MLGDRVTSGGCSGARPCPQLSRPVLVPEPPCLCFSADHGQHSDPALHTLPQAASPGEYESPVRLQNVSGMRGPHSRCHVVRSV